MSRPLHRHYAARGEHHTVVLEVKSGVLRARVDGGDGAGVDARLLRRVEGGAELWLSPGGGAVVVRDGDRVHVAFAGRTYVLDVVSDRPGADAPAVGGDEAFAESPMTGVVLAVNVAAGDAVEEGAVLCVVEAMKMEFSIEAPRDVVVDSVECAAGDRVDIGQVLVRFAADAPDVPDADGEGAA